MYEYANELTDGGQYYDMPYYIEWYVDGTCDYNEAMYNRSISGLEQIIRFGFEVTTENPNDYTLADWNHTARNHGDYFLDGIYPMDYLIFYIDGHYYIMLDPDGHPIPSDAISKEYPLYEFLDEYFAIDPVIENNLSPDDRHIFRMQLIYD